MVIYHGLKKTKNNGKQITLLTQTQETHPIFMPIGSMGLVYLPTKLIKRDLKHLKQIQVKAHRIHL